MKIETKFNIGDVLWMVNNLMLYPFIIRAIHVDINGIFYARKQDPYIYHDLQLIDEREIDNCHIDQDQIDLCQEGQPPQAMIFTNINDAKRRLEFLLRR